MVSTISGFSLILFIAAVASSISAAPSAALVGRKVFDVRSYGARGDGKTDNTMVVKFLVLFLIQLIQH